MFDDFEKQENENFQDNWKKNLIKELNEMHTAGLSTAGYFTQDLKETSKIFLFHLDIVHHQIPRMHYSQLHIIQY
jgi:hypothetical protein